jgi:hypothetical protein
MLAWAAIKYQLQEHIDRIWMNMVHLFVAGAFCELQIAFFIVKYGQKLVTFGKPISFQNPDPKVVDIFCCRCPLALSSLPPLSFPWLLDVCLGCHQLPAAGTHR